MNELLIEEMNQVSVIVSNPAYVTEATPEDIDEVDPTNLAPLVSGSAPIVTAPASEDGDVAEEKVDDGNEDDDDTEGLVKALQKVLDNLEELNKELRDLVSPRGGASTQQPPMDPIIDVWDTGKAWEREYDLYPEASRDDINIRLYNQQTWKKEDKDLVDGLTNILVMHFRLSRLTEKVLKDQVNQPNK